MSNVAIFRTGKEPQYLLSVNTGDYISDPDALINPNISAVAAVPVKHWKRSGNTIVEMTIAQKQALVDAEQAAKDAATSRLEIEAIHLAKALVALGLTTKPQLVTALKGVM